MTFLEATARVFYVMGMALVFGGTAALSFAAAPQTFKTLKPLEAGKVFGKTLAVFDRMAGLASLLAVLSAVVGLFTAVTAPGIARLVLAACVRLIVLVLRRHVAPAMAALKPPETEDDERRWDPENRRRFDLLHRQYVRLYASNLFLSLAALVLSALPG